jgi:hypothetical protein
LSDVDIQRYIASGKIKIAPELPPEQLNLFGVVTGWYSYGAGYAGGFVRDPQGVITTFEPVGSLRTWPSGIDDWGIIVGCYSDASSDHVGFAYIPRRAKEWPPGARLAHASVGGQGNPAPPVQGAGAFVSSPPASVMEGGTSRNWRATAASQMGGFYLM